MIRDFFRFFEHKFPRKVRVDVARHRVVSSVPCPNRYHFPRNAALLTSRDERMAKFMQVIDSKAADLVENGEAKAAFARLLPQAFAMATGENKEFLTMSVREMGYLAMFGTSPEKVSELDALLKEIGG